MWKHVEQQSFHMSNDEYMEQLGAVGEIINEWQLADYVREQVRETKQRPGIGVGRGPVSGAVCVSIPLMREDADGSLHHLSDGEGTVAFRPSGLGWRCDGFSFSRPMWTGRNVRLVIC